MGLQQEYAAARDLYLESLELSGTLGNEAGVAMEQHNLGWVELHLGNVVAHGVGVGIVGHHRQGQLQPGQGCLDVVTHARQHLGGYKVPRSIDFTDEFPRTETGKLVKRQLRDPYWAGRERAI